VGSSNATRDADIAARARLGQSHDSLAAEYHLTRQRIGQIVTAANPHSPEESQRAAIATRLRSRWEVLERIVAEPPEQHSAIGKVVIGSNGKPVINASVVISAVREQLKIETQYRQMFGVDLATRPGPTFNEDALLKLAEIRVMQRQLDAQAPRAALPALPASYATMTPQQQARADLERRRAALQTQRTAIDQHQADDDDEVVDAELVDE